MAVYDSIDIDFTWDGDMKVGPDGDLMSTADDAIRALENELRTIIKSERGDWKAQPNIGSDINEFLGEANTRELGRRLEERVRSRLTQPGPVLTEDLIVRAVPVHKHSILMIISVSAIATQNNRLQFGDRVTVSLTYDTIEDNIFFLPPNEKNLIGR